MCVDLNKKQAPMRHSTRRSTKAIQKRDKSLFFENSTRILVRDLHQRIQEEKMRFPKNPFKDEFLVISFINKLSLAIDNVSVCCGKSINQLVVYHMHLEKCD